MATRSRRLAALAFLLVLPGCGGTAAPPSGYVAEANGPHDGLLIPLPDGKGFGEILAKPLPKPTAKADAVIAVYFLAPDKAKALSPPPSKASLQLKTQDKPVPIDVPLSPQPDAKDPLGAALFASEPGRLLMDQLFGDLTVDLGGTSTTIPFAKSR